MYLPSMDKRNFWLSIKVMQFFTNRFCLMVCKSTIYKIVQPRRNVGLGFCGIRTAKLVRTIPTSGSLCEHLHSTKVENIPGITQGQAVQQVTKLNIAAAKGGVGIAAMKIARAYLHMLPSNLPYDEEKAREYFQMAMEYHDPEGHFGLAQLITASTAKVERESRGNMDQNWKDSQLQEAIRHLEEGALLGHAFSMFTLGVAHAFGYGTGRYDYDLAGEWLEQSGIPEGYYVASVQAGAVGDVKRRKMLEEKALAVGYAQPWRKKAREYTGSGGAGGVELDMIWPTNMDGRVPPQF
jgi:hypothetical protein